MAVRLPCQKNLSCLYCWIHGGINTCYSLPLTAAPAITRVCSRSPLRLSVLQAATEALTTAVISTAGSNRTTHHCSHHRQQQNHSPLRSSVLQAETELLTTAVISATGSNRTTHYCGLSRLMTDAALTV